MRKENKKIVISATDRIYKLWTKGFFVAQKKLSAIEQQLAKEGYHFSPAEMTMALKRASYITRRGKRGVYEYIQKGPYEKDIT